MRSLSGKNLELGTSILVRQLMHTRIFLGVAQSRNDSQHDGKGILEERMHGISPIEITTTF